MPGSPDTRSVAMWLDETDPRESMTEPKEPLEQPLEQVQQGQSDFRGVAPHDLESEQSERAAVEQSAPRPQLLLVEDDDEIRSSLQDILTDFGYSVRAEPSADAAIPVLHQYLPDAIVTDVRMPGTSGIDFCKRLTGDGPHIPVVVMTAFGDVDMAVEALRAGAFDFITKPIAIDQLQTVLERAVQQRRTKAGIIRLEDPEVLDGTRHGLVGSSKEMRQLMERIARVAPTDATVLITGESGTGKELVARAVHARSPRSQGPFVALSCAAMPLDLLEAELFGHRRGAFTGASESREGLLQGAHGGTLFLDEIGDMPLDLQPKLLRVLEDPRVRPLGGTHEVTLNVRIVAATNRDLEQAVAQGLFREDLLYRLNVHHIRVPSLRERMGDVAELAKHFLGAALRGRAYQLTPEAERLLSAHSWPGNVRELENCLSAAAAIATGAFISVRELPARLQIPALGQEQPLPEESASLEEVEKRYIEVVLRATGWNKALAARKLGIDRATLYRKLLRLGLSEP
jgi:two-component system, NtrC family, response regulator AtoC